MIDKRKAPFYMGGGIGTELEFDLQRFSSVSNPYTIDRLNDDFTIAGNIQRTLVDLSYYARDNIANYETITKIPQKNIEYLSSGLAASSCESMFNGCKKLTSIPWGDFNIDISECTSLRYMFWYCGVNNLNLYMNTSKVTDMYSMFRNCNNLTKVDFMSSFDTSSVTDMGFMFYYCESLTSLDISNFDTSKVTSMFSMFENCKSLRKITCPDGFDMSSCTDVARMFSGINKQYDGEPIHFKNVSPILDFNNIYGTEGVHYVIDSYKS